MASETAAARNSQEPLHPVPGHRDPCGHNRPEGPRRNIPTPVEMRTKTLPVVTERSCTGPGRIWACTKALPSSSTTHPVLRAHVSACQAVPVLHGVGCHNGRPPAWLAQCGPDFGCPWVPAAPARQETAQTQVGPLHQCSTPWTFFDAFAALGALLHHPACAGATPQGAVRGVCQHNDLPGPSSKSPQLTALLSSWAQRGWC